MNNKLASGVVALSLAVSGVAIADDVEFLDLDNLEISNIGEVGFSGMPVEPLSNVEELKGIELAGVSGLSCPTNNCTIEK